MRCSRIVIGLVLSLGVTLLLLWGLQEPSGSALAQKSLTPVSPTLTRQHSPVIITGGLFSNLTGNPLDQIFVYAYQGITPTQIPFQIDERDASGAYVAHEDGQLDDNDELVFMAIDGGSLVDYPLLDAGGTSILPTYMIAITDPISDTRAWVYVFWSDVLSHTVSTDYVSYNADNDRITGPGRYTLGFNTTSGFLDHLTLGDSSLNLLDRNKLQIAGTIYSIPFSANEESLTLEGVHAIDGSVRVTRVSTTVLAGLGNPIQDTTTLFAYRSLVVQPTTISVPDYPFQITYERTSIDWNEQPSGMIYYDANNPVGATIDGIPDVITSTPVSRWIQTTSVTGTVVSVNEIPVGLGGVQSTYHKDNSDINNNDTGDQRSYGDAGFQVNNPNVGNHARLGHTYFLTGITANVGATHMNYYDNPLQASVTTVSLSPTWYIYLPLVLKK